MVVYHRTDASNLTRFFTLSKSMIDAHVTTNVHWLAQWDMVQGLVF